VRSRSQMAQRGDTPKSETSDQHIDAKSKCYDLAARLHARSLCGL
jgi:hypothetical protein